VLETKLHGPISTGHNALAGVIYFGTFLAFVFQTITGFALYSSMSNSWLPQMFNWIVPLMGGEFGVRSGTTCSCGSLSRSSSSTSTLPSITITSRDGHGILNHRRMEIRAGEGKDRTEGLRTKD